MTSPPSTVARGVSLVRFNTVRTGGSAEFLARPNTLTELEALLGWADSAGLEVHTVGSGSNLLIADEGVGGLVIKLAGELAQVQIDPPHMVCGGGARLPAVAAVAAQAGLSGLEFGVSIPGTVGGAVRMNANAYGGALAAVLEWVEVTDAAGTRRRDPGELGFAYRRSGLRDGQVVTRARFRLLPTAPSQARATLAELRARRRASQPAGIRTFGSTFKNPDDPRAEGRTAGQLLDAAGCRGLRVGGAGFSDKHANFIENIDGASTADVVALMEEGVARVRDCVGVELEPEVHTLGPVKLPARWRTS